MSDSLARPAALDLLRVELDVLWGIDGPDRRATVQSGVLIGATDEGYTAVIGGRLPPAVRDEIEAAMASAPARANQSVLPPAVSECRRLLESRVGPVETERGPSYLIPPGTAFASAVTIRRSGCGDVDELRPLNPGNWGAHEWDLLLEGSLGPWAMALVDRRVAAICHTPRPLTSHGAEAGVWTEPEFRGRGMAAAVTAAWAAMLAPSGRHLFYSTAADNLSSQRVAARLKLPPVGTLWTISCEGHSLS